MKTLLILCSILAVISCFQNFSVPNNATATLLVNLHNIERAAIGLYNLTWSNDLAQSSQDWANYLAANNKFKHSGTAWVGENIAQATIRSNMTAFMFSQWSSEKKYFNPQAKWGDANISTDSTMEVGHYTQIIWSMTYQVGCGIANTSNSWSIMVCQYKYPGNYIGSYVYKPDPSNPWKVVQPVVNPATLPPPPPLNYQPSVMDNATAQQILDLHNTERKFVGMKNLTWSPTLAVSAQANANKNALTGHLYLSGLAVGENLQSATIGPNIVAGIFNSWRSERVNFDATKVYPKCAMNSKMVSHYTQIVWSASYEIGCGLATNSKNAILDCQYRLGGNYIGNYAVYPAPKMNFDFTL